MVAPDNNCDHTYVIGLPPLEAAQWREHKDVVRLLKAAEDKELNSILKVRKKLNVEILHLFN